MPALMNSSVGSFTGITEAAPICWCCLEVKDSMYVWRISSLLAGRFMLPVFRPAMARANTFPAGWPPSVAPAATAVNHGPGRGTGRALLVNNPWHARRALGRLPWPHRPDARDRAALDAAGPAG